MILGEPTHDREDLTDYERRYPDNQRLKGYIVPPGCGIIIKKGVWHDFPIIVGPDVTVLTVNAREVVEALMSMKKPDRMNFGDCYKVKTLDINPAVNLVFLDPRAFSRLCLKDKVICQELIIYYVILAFLSIRPMRLEVLLLFALVRVSFLSSPPSVKSTSELPSKHVSISLFLFRVIFD
jgi:hypothetical protein